MVWRDQDPPAADVLLDINMPFSGGGTPAYLEIDKLANGRYRATVGTLFPWSALRLTQGADAHASRERGSFHARCPTLTRKMADR
jgi:hypothetical protein